MKYYDFILRSCALHISTHLMMKRKIKTLNGKAKNKLNKGLNINV